MQGGYWVPNTHFPELTPEQLDVMLIGDLQRLRGPAAPGRVGSKEVLRALGVYGEGDTHAAGMSAAAFRRGENHF